MCHSSSAPVSDRAAIAATAAPRTMSEPISTRRRSTRSETAPPNSSSTIVGMVIAMPTIDSAAGAFDSSYTCQAIATRKMPSPTSDAVIPIHSRRKSRWRSGASGFTQE